VINGTSSKKNNNKMVKDIDEWGNTIRTIKHPKCLKKHKTNKVIPHSSCFLFTVRNGTNGKKKKKQQ